MDRAMACMAAKQHGVFSRSQALALGFSHAAIRHRVEAGRWAVVHRGVYRLSGTPVTWRSEVMAACLAAAPGAVAGGPTAARLLGLPVATTGAIEVLVPPGRRVRRAGVEARRVTSLAPSDVTVVDGVPTTEATRTILDLARTLGQPELDQVLDVALARRLTSLRRLERRVGAATPQAFPGVGMLRELVRMRDPRVASSRSPLNARFERLFRRLGFDNLVPEYPVRVPGGRLVRLDFADPVARLAVEIDSQQHHASVAEREHDLARQNALVALGFRVLRFGASDLPHPDRVDGQLREVLRRAG